MVCLHRRVNGTDMSEKKLAAKHKLAPVVDTCVCLFTIDEVIARKDSIRVVHSSKKNVVDFLAYCTENYEYNIFIFC